MDRPQHVVVRISNAARVAPFTLATMGRTAKELGSTWTFREWAARLAAKAPPRDYVAQLGHLYRGILRRWRYVAEPEEWVHGSAKSAIGHVLGAKYNRGPSCPHPLRCDLESTPTSGGKGWGDCDDAATIVAGGVYALGMVPAFRVVRWPGGAHVSVVARTPRKQLVSVDPVGHPDHPFGWVMAPPASSPSYWNMEGQRIA